MGLKEKLDQDLKEAIKQRDERRKSALRMVKTAIRRLEVEKMRELSDEEIQQVIAQEVKRHRQSIEEFSKGGREDLAEAEKAELEILQAYLPEALSEEEIEAAARRVIEEIGATDPRQLGEVMRRLMPQLKGRAEGKVVNQIVREILAGER